MQLNISLTNATGCTGAVIATLPATAQGRTTLLGRETALTGSGLISTVADGAATATIGRYDGASMAATGNVLTLSGTYQTP